MIRTNYEILLLVERNKEIENNVLYFNKLIKKLIKQNFNLDSFIKIKKITNYIQISILIRNNDNLQYLIKIYYSIIDFIDKRKNLLIYHKRITQSVTKKEIINVS